jgi:hypothetical protein
MNRLRPTSAADQHSIAGKNGHTDVVDTTIDRVLAAAPETSGEDCPDATALAAWYEAPRDQSHHLDAHLADCARCQSIVAAIARAEGAAAAPAPAVRRWRRPVLMLPALAGLVLIIVGAARVFRRSQNAARTSGMVAIQESPSTGRGNSSNAVIQAPPQFTTGELVVTPDASISNRVETTMATRVSGPGAVVVAAPDHSVEWLIGKHGAILRRESDHSIHAQASGVETDLTAGAAVSSAVCWVIGTSGTILRTTDGQHWEILPAPTAMDLVSVQANTADAALVVAAGGLSYITIDGGKTWARR